MSPNIDLTTFEGFPITVDQWGNFRVEIEGTPYSSKLLNEVEGYIKDHLKAKTSFTPMEAIQIGQEVFARITSRDVKHSDYFRITHINRKGERERGKRSLERRHGRPQKIAHYYVKKTPENIVILSNIWNLRDKQKELDVQIKALKETFKDPIFSSDFKEE